MRQIDMYQFEQDDSAIVMSDHFWDAFLLRQDASRLLNLIQVAVSKEMSEEMDDKRDGL